MQRFTYTLQDVCAVFGGAGVHFKISLNSLLGNLPGLNRHAAADTEIGKCSTSIIYHVTVLYYNNVCKPLKECAARWCSVPAAIFTEIRSIKYRKAPGIVCAREIK